MLSQLLAHALWLQYRSTQAEVSAELLLGFFSLQVDVIQALLPQNGMDFVNLRNADCTHVLVVSALHDWDGKVANLLYPLLVTVHCVAVCCIASSAVHAFGQASHVIAP